MAFIDCLIDSPYLGSPAPMTIAPRFVTKTSARFPAVSPCDGPSRFAAGFPTRTLAAACATALLLLAQGPALAQSTAATAASPATGSTDPGEYKPYSGQAGKDVVWVPTPQLLVDSMLDSAGLTRDDYVIDLGSGDGRTVITAAKRGARARGIEFNGDMVALARRHATEEGVGDKVVFDQGDIFQSDFSQATILTLFLLPQLNLRLRPTILDMKPGTRVVSNSFDMGDWQPDANIDGGPGCKSWCRAYKWIVPAKVGGDWQFGSGKLHLEQTYQKLAGTLTEGGKTLPISDAKMNGTRITFSAGGRNYEGQANGKAMSGAVDGKAWSATRLGS